MSQIDNLPTADQVDDNQKVILRLDLDLPFLDEQILDNSRLIKSMPTIRVLLEKGCRLVIIGHRGRPIIDSDESKAELSLRPVYVELMSLLEEGEDSLSSVFVEEVSNRDIIFQALEDNQIVFLENLRFWREESEGKVDFLGHLVEIGSVFVNDALAVAHRENASILLAKMMPTFYGMAFAREVEKMSQILLEPKKPLLIILGGVKKDKLDQLTELASKADRVLVGGKLPTFKEKYANFTNVVWGQLDESGMDINKLTIDRFVSEIEMAGTVLLAGAMGKFEDSLHKEGSQLVTEAVARCEAVKMAAGGDTKASILEMGLVDRFDYICSGGGVALEFLARDGKLPAWD